MLAYEEAAMSASFSWRHEPIPQALQQQRGSQLVPPDMSERSDEPLNDRAPERDIEAPALTVQRKLS